jgi:hypothetical protein
MAGMAGVGRRRSVSWLALVAVAVVIVSLGASLDRPTVHDRQDLGAVAFGTPWPWLLQDQIALGPPFPHQATFLSPLENPTTVAWWALCADLLVVMVALAALSRVGSALLARSSRGDAPRAAGRRRRCE